MEETEIKIILSISGEQFDPQEISNLLNIKSTNSWIKGDLIKSRKIKMYRQETNWEISYEEKSINLEDVLDTFIKKYDLNKKTNILYNFCQKEDLFIKLYIVLDIVRNKIPGLYFNHKILKFINDIKAEIDFDTYIDFQSAADT